MNPITITITITITNDQALEIAVRKDQVKGLLYLLATCVAAHAHCSPQDPSPDEAEGILGLISTVGGDLDRALEPLNQAEAEARGLTPTGKAS